MHLFTDCFMKVSPESPEQIQLLILIHPPAQGMQQFAE